MGLMGSPPGILGQPFGSKLGGFSGSYSQKIRSVFGSSLKGHWPLCEASGLLAYNRVGCAVGNVLPNGDFETSGGGGADVFKNWSEVASDGALEDETSLVYGGSHAVKLTTGPTLDTRIWQMNILVVPGADMRVSFWTRGDGTYAGRYAIYDEENATWVQSLVTTGVTGTTYTEVTKNFTVPAGCSHMRMYFYGPNTNGGIAYFDECTWTSLQSLNGLYSSSGITYGEAGIGDGLTSTKYDGNNSSVLIGNPFNSSVFNGNKGSVIAWGKVDGASRWTDASTYRYLWHPKSSSDQTVYMVMGKNQTNHQLVWRRRVAGTILERTYEFSPSGTLDWFCMGMTWDVTSSPKIIRGYLYTADDDVWQKVFDLEDPASDMELWDTGTYPVDDANYVLMAGSTSAQEWIGWGAHVALGAGVVLNDAQMEQVMSL